MVFKASITTRSTIGAVVLIALFAQGRLIGAIPDAVPVSDLRSLVERIRISTGQADASRQWATELAALCDAVAPKDAVPARG